jgi:hypothetical protein
MARITDQRQNLHMGADYRDVEKIDQDLTMFADRLPLYFSMYDPETSFDSRKLPTPNKLIAELLWLPVHRYYLLSELQVLIMILHVSRQV